MTIDHAQEYALEKRPDTALWSENFALVFADPEQRISALYSIGTWYQDTSVWRENLVLTLPDGEILVGRNFGRNTRGAVVSASLSRYEIIEPDKKVKLSYDGPASSNTFQDLMRVGSNGGKTRRLRLALDFTATSPTWDMHAGHAQDKTGLAGAMHIEQLGQCEGLIRVDDREFAIKRAYACRDHSRGARDNRQYRNHCWLNGRFSGGRGFQLYNFRMHHIEGVALSLATVIEGGKHHAATIEHIDYVNGPEEFGRLQSVLLKSTLGDMKISVNEVLSSIPTTMTSPFNPAAGVQTGLYGQMFDEGIRIEWNGATGFGWSERGYSHQPLG
jgi:hypothetical protein